MSTSRRLELRSVFAPRRWSIRFRTALTAFVVVGLAVVILGIGLIAFMRWMIVNNENRTLDELAGDIVATLEQEGPAAAAEYAYQPTSGIDLVQLRDAGGDMLTERPAAEKHLEGLEYDAAGAATFHDEVIGTTGTTYRVLTVAVPDADVPGVQAVEGRYELAVGVDTGRTDFYTDIARGLIAIGVPLAGLTAGFVTWMAMRRALDPVERIRSRVAEIQTTYPGDRVPVPESGDEIARLAETMNDMLVRLDHGREQQIAFVGDASHELRSPLSTLSAMLELSSTSGEPLDVETVDTLLLPEVTRMRTIVEDLLLLAKTDELGSPLRFEDVDLDDIVYAEAMRLRGVGVESVDVSIEPARVTGDGTSLARVVRNLAENARRHHRRRIALKLSVEPGPTAVIVVDDDGDGIPEEQRRVVFDRFARLGVDRARDTGGSGLGLAIVAEIVRVHGGSVTVGDAPLGGARFTLAMPCQSNDGLTDPGSY